MRSAAFSKKWPHASQGLTILSNLHVLSFSPIANSHSMLCPLHALDLHQRVLPQFPTKHELPVLRSAKSTAREIQ